MVEPSKRVDSLPDNTTIVYDPSKGMVEKEAKVAFQRRW